MRRTLALALVLACIYGTSLAQGSPLPGRNFTTEKVADGVYALIRNEPASLWFNPNNVFIIGKTDVIVVDSNISSEYTREVLAELRRLTDKPVKYVINTHWHEDHIIGNRVYRGAFPGVKFVGHRSTLKDLSEVGGANRQGSIKNGPGFLDLLKGKVQKGENLAGRPITDEERDGYASDIRLVSSYLAESAAFEIVLPDVLVDDQLTLTQDGRRVEVRFLGRAHTGADLVVHLPRERILISGDLIVHPVPLVGSTSYPLEYGSTLETLLTLNAKVFIPGHGPIMRDTSYVRSMIELLRSLKRQAEASSLRGETLEQMRKNMDLGSSQTVFTGDSQHRRFIFANYVTQSATAAAHKAGNWRGRSAPSMQVYHRSEHEA